MLKNGWPILAIGAVAVAVVGTKLANFDIPHMFNINAALAGTTDKDAPKIEAPKALEKSAVNNNHGLATYQEPVSAPQ